MKWFYGILEIGGLVMLGTGIWMISPAWSLIVVGLIVACSGSVSSIKIDSRQSKK